MSRELSSLIDKMDNEINEIDLKAIPGQIGGAIKKGLKAIPQALRIVYDKMAKTIQTIESAWFRFGGAIVQLKNNKFALFNKKGKNLTGDLDNLQRREFSGKQVPVYKQKSSKHGVITGYLQPDGRVAFAKMEQENNAGALLYIGPSVFDKKLIQVEGAPISDAQKIFLQETYVEAMERPEREQQYVDVKKQATVEFGIQDFMREVVKEEPREIASALIVISDLSEILLDMAVATEAGAAKKRKFSMLLYGGPGIGKSEVIGGFYEKRGYEVTLLNIQTVPVETFGGFPVIKLSGTADGKKGGKDVVKMVVSDLLPDPDSKGKHLLFLDEFNTGTPEQMKAAMGLALTGKIGSTYEVPKKTVVIAAGNAPEKDNATAVSTLDAPTLRRYVFKVRLEADLPEWLKGYARKDVVIDYEGQKVNTGPIISIITRNLVKWSEEEKDPAAGFKKIMQGFGGEEETAWLDPATWAAVDEQVKLRGLMEYKDLSDEQKTKIVEFGKKQFKNMKTTTEKEKFAIGARTYIVGKQDEIFKRVAPRILGKDSENIVSEMIANYEEFKTESISATDIILNYKSIRKKAMDSRTLDSEILLNDIASEIADFGSVKALEEYVKSKGITLLKSAGGDPLAHALMNVGQFIKDTDVGAEIITAHFEALAPALELKNQLVIEWKAGLLQLGSDRIMAGWNGFLQSIEKQFGDIGTDEDKNKFMQMRKARQSFNPIIQAAKRIKNSETRKQFIDTETRNFLLHFSKSKKAKKKEEGIESNEDQYLQEMLELAGVK